MFKGKGVSVGIGFGTAVVLKEQERKIEKTTVDEPEKEMIRFKDALKQVEEDTQQIVDSATGTEKEIMSAYLMIIQDPTLTVETENAISNLKYNAEYAVDVGFNSVIQLFESMDDEYMAGRARDIADIKNRVLAKLANEETINISKLPENTIIVATELTTSDTAKLDFKNVSGIISEIGGTNSHTSIMARTHAIPAITRVEDATKIFRNGDKIAINGSTGEIFLNPTQEETEQLQKLQKQLKEETEELEKYKKLDTRTKDDYKVELVANIGTPADIESVIKNSAEGVGLFRSEFLYMDNENMPTEEEQFEAYKKVAEAMGDKPVIIRTLDVGGDKEIKYLHLEKEANPFLGYRAIRLCLDNITIFKIQLRAILRASAFGNLSIMFPMITAIEEVTRAKLLLETAKRELKAEKTAFDEDIQIGVMIETPAAVMISGELAREVDFFSIGTNDLTQFTLGMDRTNDKLGKFYNSHHSALIKMIRIVANNVHLEGKKISICGDLAADLDLTETFIQMGIDELSVTPNQVLALRKKIREIQ